MRIIYFPDHQDDFIQLRPLVDFRDKSQPWFYSLGQRPEPVEMDAPPEAMVLYLGDKRKKWKVPSYNTIVGA